ncbi:MAG: GreA/GreB family elongation factor [Patescibacteria group bacterium]
MQQRKNFMLRDTHQKLVAEYEAINTEFRVEIPKEIGHAYQVGGDWHDNPGYDAAMEKQRNTASRLADLTELLRSPVFIETLQISGDEVRIGVNVTLSYSSNGEVSYDILGPADARYREGVMSCFSPLAQQLMGHKSGEEVLCKLPKGKEKIRIIKVEKINF